MKQFVVFTLIIFIISFTQCSEYHSNIHSRTHCKVIEGKLKNKIVSIIGSANTHFNTDNIWAHPEARKHALVSNYYLAMLDDLYSSNQEAQKHLRQCYNEAPDLKPLLPHEYLSKEYFFVSCYDTQIKQISEYLVPREWLLKIK